MPTIVVNENDIWLSNFSPNSKKPDSVQVRVHNTSTAVARNIGVSIYSHHIATGKRTLLTKTEIAKLGPGSHNITKPNPPSLDHHIIDGIKHPAINTRGTLRAQLNRALVDANWSPDLSGYYWLEVELKSSKNYSVDKKLVRLAIPVGGE